VALFQAPPSPSNDDALALGRLIEPWLSAAQVTVDQYGGSLELPPVRLSLNGHLQVLRWIRHELAPQQEVRTDG